ncbi:MAG TPA: nuclear transport factor 2 family protein [Myxococcaceae bacterium]
MSGTSGDGEVLLRLNDEYLRASERSDGGWFEEHLAPDFLCSRPDGTLLDRAAFLVRASTPSSLSDLEGHDVVVRLLGDVALVHARTTFRDGGRPGHGRYTDIWAKQDGRWVAVAAHVTRC